MAHSRQRDSVSVLPIPFRPYLPSPIPIPTPSPPVIRTPSTALHNANAKWTGYVRLQVGGSGVLDAVARSQGDTERIVVTGRDTLKIIRIVNRLPSSPPMSPLSPASPPTPTPLPPPLQRSHSDRGHTRRAARKATGPGGSTMEEVVNVWSGSKLGLTYSCLGVAWGHQNFSEKIVTCCINGQCVVWDLNKSPSKVETYLPEHTRAVNRVTFHPHHSHYLLSASSDGFTKLWDLRRPFSSAATFRHNSPVHAACFAPQIGGSQFMVGLENGAVQRFDFRMDSRGMTDWISSAHAGAVLDVKWREYGINEEWGTWLATCGMDKTVKVWDLSQPIIPRTPKHVLRTSTRNRRIAWRPGSETELVVVPQPYSMQGSGSGEAVAAGAGAKDGGVEVGQHEMNMLCVWDVRRNWVPKYALEGGTTVPTDIVFTHSSFDTVVATYKDAQIVQHDFRHHRRPIDHLCRAALSWDASGRMAFAAEERAEREIPFDEPPYDERGQRMLGTIEQSCKGPKYAPVNQVAAGALVPALVDAEAMMRMARSYVLHGGEVWDVCAANAKVALSARHHKAAQAWQLLHALLLPLPLPSRSPSPPFPSLSTPAKSSKYSFSPLSSTASHSRRATSAGPSRTRRPRGGRHGRPGVGRKVTAPVIMGGDMGADGKLRDRRDSTGSMQHVGEGALEDSDSDGEREEGEAEETDTDRDRDKEKSSAHGRNLSSESGVGLGQLLASTRSPLSQTPVTAGGMLNRSARVEEEPEREEEAEGGWLSRTDTDGAGTSGEMSESSSGRRRARGTVRLAGVQTPTAGTHAARRSSVDTEVQSDPVLEMRKARGSNGIVGTLSLEKEKDRSRGRSRRLRKDVVNTEERVREAAWGSVRRVWEGFVSEGDVQTAAMMAIVAGEKLVKEDWRIGRLVQAYLDLLGRLQLYTSAAYIRKNYVNPEVQDPTNSGTIVASTCAKCHKPLRGQTLKPGEVGPTGHFAYCATCNRSVTRCSICHLPSKSLFFSCPTCGHGGHEECYREYYLSRPTENMQPVFPTQTLLPPHMLNSRNSGSSEGTVMEEAAEDLMSPRTGRPTAPKKREPAPSVKPRTSRVHAAEAEEDSEEEMMKERFWARKTKSYKRVLLGHPCLAGCGHVCWLANDRIFTKAS